MSKRFAIGVIGVAAAGVALAASKNTSLMTSRKWSRDNSSIAVPGPGASILKKISDTAQSLTQNLK